MLRFLFLFGFLLCSLLPQDVSAQRQKKSIVSGTGSADKADTDEKEADMFDKPVRKKRPPVKATQPNNANNGSAKKGSSKESDLPEPEVVVINSRQVGTEGINLSCTLFLSANSEDAEQAKTISPMILVHDWGGSMLDLAPLARHLQSAGHTVLVPDLRGHGRSTTMVNQTEIVDYSEFKKADFGTIWKDLEACKRFLMQYNNEGKLNISMLSVLAVGDMCPVATEWVLRDWSFASRGRIKQGKDVQSLLLISPKRKFKTYSLNQLVRAPLLSGKNSWHIPMMVIWGGDSKSAKESNAIYKVLSKNRPASEAEDPAERWAEQDLYRLELPVAQEGSDLLRPNDAIYKFIATFNEQKIMLNAAQFPWQSRGKKKAEK